MEIKVFGPGCPKCHEVENLVREVVAARGCNTTVTKVSDLKEMMAAGIMSTPAVMFDGQIKSLGKVPTKTEIASWFEGGGEPLFGNPSQSSGGCCCKK